MNRENNSVFLERNGENQTGNERKKERRKGKSGREKILNFCSSKICFPRLLKKKHKEMILKSTVKRI